MVIALKNTSKWKPENGNQKMETTASKMEVSTNGHCTKKYKQMETRKWKPENGNHCE